jgi:diguanylate cyclase (GGDEF)-like protein/PAS domain S-box-containing protein
VTTIERILILAGLVGIFVLDAFSPLGAPIWLLYLFPVLYFSLKAGRTEVVFHMSLITVFMVTDFFLSPPGIEPLFAGINRALWIVALWSLSLFNLWRNDMLANLRVANEAIRESENNLRTIFDSSHDAIFIHDLDGKIIDLNRKGLEMYGIDAEEAPALTIADLSSPDNPLASLPEIMRKTAAGENQYFQWQARRPKDDSVFDEEVFLTRLRLKEKTAILATVRDITERKRMEDELRLTRFSVDHASVCAYLVARDARLLYVNDQTCRTLGYSREELLSMAVYDLDPDFPASVWDAHWTHLKKEGGLHFETSQRRKDGTLVPLDMSLNFLAFGDREYNVAFALDISERKKAEEALKQAYGNLETKVRERTRALAEANRELRLEIGERQRAEEVIRRSKELSDGLNRLAALIHSTLNLDEIMHRVVEEAARTMNADAALICGFEGDTFQVRHAHNMPAAFTGRKLEPDELRGLYQAVRVRDALAFNDAFNDDRLNTEFVRQTGIRSLLVAPLFTNNKVAGGLAFYGLSRRITFNEAHIDFARKLATSISLALENGQLYQALAESEKLSSSRLAQLETIYDTAPIGLCFLDRDYRYLNINKRLAEINGIPVKETVGRTVRELLPQIADQVETACRQAVETGRHGEYVEITEKSKAKGNQAITVLSLYNPVRNQSGEILGYNVVVQDITERKRMEETLQASEQSLRAIVNSIPDLAWLKDTESRFILVNEAFGAAAGKKPEELTGKTDFEAWPDDLAEKYRADDREVVGMRKRKRVEEPLALPDGSRTWIETIKTPFFNKEGEVIGTAGIARDTTERRRMEEEIRHMALHDVLTGLPNRRLLMNIITVSVAEARRHRNKLAILFLDLDRFKDINDTLGHEAGDQLLKTVAERLKETVRESDTVARIGGDEFNILLTDLTRVEDACATIRKVIDCFQVPFQIVGHELHVTTSIGISIYPDDSTEIDTLFRYADIALYHAKELGKNTYEFYNPTINIRSVEKMRMESFLRQTLKRGELVVHYQALVDIKTQRIVCAEALVRWRHPEKGLLPPKRFIPMAEESGFITAIDEWVLRNVCAQTRAWLDAGLPPFCVTVNLSAREFQNPELVRIIAGILAETELPPEFLDIEITESTAMHDIERAIARLDQLAAMGVGISIDDFGTGYSSLSYLKRMPVQKIKIDRSFVKDIAIDSDDRAIIRAVTAMAHNMKMRVVAEGVETADQLSFLHEADCDEAQGYLFSRPLPAEKFKELLAMGVGEN